MKRIIGLIFTLAFIGGLFAQTTSEALLFGNLQNGVVSTISSKSDGEVKTTEISMSNIGIEADKKVEKRLPFMEDNTAVIECPLQAMRGAVTADGLVIKSSTKEEGQGNFNLRPLTYSKGELTAVGNGLISIAKDAVLLNRGNLTERFTSSTDGIRQDFILAKSPAGTENLSLVLELKGATAANSAQGVSIKMDNGRKLEYHNLYITDATGKRMTGEMKAVSEGLIAIHVNDAEAVYPLTIDPTITDADWVALNTSYPGTDNTVNSIAISGSNMYIGGTFLYSPGGAANRIAKWDGSAWSALGSGMDNTVSAIAIDGSGNVYAGGNFTLAGGVADTKYIAKWDVTTSAWSPLGTGLAGAAAAIAIDGSGNVYAGGSFASAGVVANTSKIARWDGTAWSALGSGMNGNVSAIAIDGSGNLYAGGAFTSAGGVANTSKIAKWNVTTSLWSALGSGMSATVAAIAIDPSGNVYAAGIFANAGGVPANNIAKWNVTTSLWSALGSGTNSSVSAIAIDGSGNVYAGGDFGLAGGVAGTLRIAKWNGTAWSALGSGATSNVAAIAVSGSNVYAGGSFTTVGGVAALRIAKWNGTAWSSFGTGLDAQVKAIAINGSNMYIGGEFTFSAGGAANRIAKWDGSSWSALGSGLDNAVNAIAIDGSGNVYVGGPFTLAGGVANTAYIAKWNGSAWSALGTGLSGAANAIAIGGSGIVYVGGAFTLAGGVANTSRIAKWDGSAWSALGTGLNGAANAIAIGGSGIVYVGGAFATAGGTSVNYIAKWDGTAWSALGSGMNTSVTAIAINGSGNVYAGGNFTLAGGVANTSKIAKWDGFAWSALGSGTNNNVSAIAIDGSNNVYAGGTFTTAGGVPANRIAKWNGTAWSALGSGANNTVNALAMNGTTQLIVGGSFTAAGNKFSPYLAKVINLLGATPTISSFTPTSAGTGTTVTITGTSFTDATAVSFGDATATSFTVVDATSITAVVANGATGTISVTTPGGIAISTGTFTFLPAPTITSFSPTSGAIGSSVTITGTNFNTTAANNIVYFGATKATVTAATAFNLTVTVPTGANYQYISVTNSATNLTAYSAQPFIPTFSGSMNFASKIDFATGSSPYATAMGDIDGDGIPDMVTANLSSNTVSIIRNTSTSGSVSFDAKVDITTSTGPRYITLVDFNGDGKLDIAVTASGSGSINVFCNTSTSGSISFATPLAFILSYPQGVSFGDFDGDGKPDLVVAGLITNDVNVYPNTSTSGIISFGTKVSFTTGAGSNPANIRVGDINGDSKPDIAVTNGTNSTVSVFRNTSTGTGNFGFATHVDFATGTSPFGISIGDIDGDGKPDLAIANNATGVNTVSVLRNTSTVGTVNFATKEDLACFAGTNPQVLCLGDIDGDGKPDIAVAGFAVGKLMVFKNTSTSGVLSFATRTDITSLNAITDINIIDIDGDGKPDIVETSTNTAKMSVFRQVILPVISSFTPTAAGNGTTVEITGTNFTGTTDVSFGGTAAASFIENSSTSISAVVAAGATGIISVTTSAGSGFSTDTFTYTIIPLLSTQAVSSIASTTATGNGNITDIGAANPATRGSIWYAYTNTDKIISDAGVTSVPEAGSFSTGTFTSSLTGLAANTHYNTRAYATNSYGTGYGARVAFWTLANVPSAPTVNNPTATTLDVTINVNSNPTTTEFAIKDSVNGTFVQANGSMGASAVWQTATAWGTKTITGLTTATSYTFNVKARNYNITETAYSAATSGMPVAAPSVEWYGSGGGNWLETQPAGASNKIWQSVAVSEDGMKMLASVQNGRLYKSTDGGTSWSEAQPAGAVDKNWSSVSVSGDGQKMLASVFSGRLYMSTDGGTSWSETQPAGASDKYWAAVSVSGDGQKMFASVFSGRLYLSTNGGTSWSETQPAGNNNNGWQCVCISGDGQTMLAGDLNGRLYMSANGGTSWSETQPVGNAYANWKTVSVSGNGQIMLACVYLGRLYKSTNGGTSWSETQPAGNTDLYWQSVSVSGDGQKMLAGVQNGRLYLSTDAGTSWSETQPVGNANANWSCVLVSGNGMKMLAGVSGGRLYSSTAIIFDTVTATTASASGNITATNGANATTRGAIVYPYTDTDKIIGDAGVADVNTSGSYSAGTYAISFNGLTPNTRYNARAYAINTFGTTYGVRSDFYTLANVPTAPTVNNPTAATLDIAINANSNPSITEFAIHDSVNGTFVQANGSLGVSAVWQTASAWGTKTITGLTLATSYTFNVKARNGANVETAYSVATSGMPVDKPTVKWDAISSSWGEIHPDPILIRSWASCAMSSDGLWMLAGNYNRLYKSNTGGATWSETQPLGNTGHIWNSVSISSDGSTWLAAEYGAGINDLFRSLNHGTSWDNISPIANKGWVAALSSDGTTILASSTGGTGGRLYISTNSGTSWLEVQPAGNADKLWLSVSVSSNGLKMLASTDTRLYMSADGGASWNEIQPAGNTDQYWISVSMSADGLKMLAANGSRVYKSTNGGISWSDTQAAGDVDVVWGSVTVSADGTTMLAGAQDFGTSRLYKSGNGGVSWIETQPAGDVDVMWGCVAVSADGSTMLAGTDAAMYRLTSILFSPVTNTTAAATGNIIATNGANATTQGAIVYPFTGTDKIIGDAGVADVNTSGTYSAGTYSVSFTGLTPNTRYNARAYAINTYGTTYGVRGAFRTLANVPNKPTVDNPTATTLDVAVNANGNPVETEFAIQDSVNNLYVKADGTRGADTLWLTAAAWGTKTLTGLTTGSTYYLRVKARNGDKIETAYSVSTAQSTCSNPTAGGTIAINQAICNGTSPSALSSVTLPANYSGTLEYKWQYSTPTDSLSFTDIANNSIGYAPGNLTATTWFKRVVRVSCANDWIGAAESNVVKITIRPLFTAGAIETTGESICNNGDPAEIGNTSLANGGNDSLVYQWQSSLDEAFTTPTNINSNTPAYDPPAGLAATTWFRRQAKDGACNTSWNTSTGVWKVTTNSPTPILTGNENVTQGQVVTYSTPYNPGNSYTWNASHGNPEICFPNRNCLTLTWDFPCGVINPGYVKVTETNPSTGCSTTVTKWITIAQ